MALDRFKNIDEIIQNSGKTKGIVWKEEDIDLLALDVKTVTPIDSPVVECIRLATQQNMLLVEQLMQS